MPVHRSSQPGAGGSQAARSLRQRGTRPVSPTQAPEASGNWDAERTMHAALRLLEHRARSAHELRQRLQRIGAPAGRISEALQRLSAMGYVDDGAFARQWTESRLRTGHGRRRIAQELHVKGVAPELIRRELDAQAPPAEELTGALEHARRRLRAWQRLPAAARQRRLQAFLQRRGFAVDVIEQVMERLVSESDDRDEAL